MGNSLDILSGTSERLTIFKWNKSKTWNYNNFKRTACWKNKILLHRPNYYTGLNKPTHHLIWIGYTKMVHSKRMIQAKRNHSFHLHFSVRSRLWRIPFVFSTWSAFVSYKIHKPSTSPHENVSVEFFFGFFSVSMNFTGNCATIAHIMTTSTTI